VLAAKVKKVLAEKEKKFWKNFGEGWVLAAKVKFLEMEFRSW